VVDAKLATLVAAPPDGGRSGLMLSATNIGRSTAIIRQWGFDNPREVYTAGPGDGLWSLGPATPHTLSPGASQVWWLDFKEHKTLLDFSHPGDHFLRGYVVLGTRRRKTSRSFITDGGTLVSPSRIRRYVQGKLRKGFGVGVLVLGKLGSDHFVLSLQRTGPWLSFTKLRIDVIIEEDDSRRSFVVPGSAMERRFWLKKQILIDIPNDLVAKTGAWYRLRWYAGRRPHEQRNRVPSAADLAALQRGNSEVR
jgi:hypothetical protein